VNSILKFQRAGSILNRFTKDLISVDEMLPTNIFDMCVIFLQMLVSMIFIVLVDYYMIIPIVLLVTILCIMRSFYIRISIRLRRLEALGMLKIG